MCIRDSNKDYYSLKLNFKKHLFKKYSTIEFKQLKKENKFFNDFENYEWKYFNKNNQIALTKLSKKRFSDFKIDYNLNENTVSLDPVSYTHLDVYKRQGVNCVGRT